MAWEDMPPHLWPETAQDEHEERRAILEFDAGMTREQAEQESRLMIREKMRRWRQRQAAQNQDGRQV